MTTSQDSLSVWPSCCCCCQASNIEPSILTYISGVCSRAGKAPHRGSSPPWGETCPVRCSHHWWRLWGCSLSPHCLSPYTPSFSCHMCKKPARYGARVTGGGSGRCALCPYCFSPYTLAFWTIYATVPVSCTLALSVIHYVEVNDALCTDACRSRSCTLSFWTLHALQLRDRKGVGFGSPGPPAGQSPCMAHIPPLAVLRSTSSASLNQVDALRV